MKQTKHSIAALEPASSAVCSNEAEASREDRNPG
jgi:hypothetical protein